MTLLAGARLGPYEILALIGSGGMGEVYRATDVRLGRTLAIKVLRADLAGGGDRTQRFEREARAVAALNHPHICSLHDVGHVSGVDFLVLEYLEAPTLAERLLKGPLSVDQVLRYAIEIADALDHAHSRGIVHRDLKPSNVMLTKSGAKVLDFGLARLRAGDPLAAAVTAVHNGPPLTADSALLGTFQYMAPEQLEGREADPRADIFALGLLLYEMTTGRHPFAAATPAAAVGAILHTEPAAAAELQPDIPPELDHVITRSLAKDPDQRWQTARDLLLELTAALNGITRSTGAGVWRRSRDRREALMWTAVALIAVATVLLSVARLSRPGTEGRPVQLSIVPTEPTGDFSLSPDGRVLAFVAGRQGHTRLFVRALESATPQPLAGTEGAESLFWSPDSRFLAFGAGGKLKKVEATGGPVLTLCDARAVIGGSWSSGNVIVFAPNNRMPLFKVSATGGEPTPVTTLDPSEEQNSHRWPSFLPDGRHFLYLARSARQERNAIYIGSIDSTLSKRVTSGHSLMVYAQPGYVLSANDGPLLAYPFDVRTLRITGDPAEVLDDVRHSTADGYAAFSISEHGELAYQTAAAVPRSELVWVNRMGQRLDLPVGSGNAVEPSVAPDGYGVAFMRWEKATSDIWEVDGARGGTSRLTFHPAVDFAPVWSPTGRAIVFASNRKGPSDLYHATLDGTRSEKLLLESSGIKHATDWSRDGRLIVYESRGPRVDWDLWTLPLAGDAREQPYLQTGFSERLGRLSPNGRWMAYVSDESGQDEVYVRPFPLSKGQWLISTAGGTEPRWRRDGSELYYLAGDHKLMAVPVQADIRFAAGLPKALFDAPMIEDRVWGYDVAPDGQRFVIGRAVTSTSPPVNVILNWSARLAR